MATSSSSLCPSVSRDYGVSDPLRCGLAPRRERTEVGHFGHPLEASEKAFESTRHANELEQLRKLQGLHAPIRMQMERKAVNKVCLVVVVCMLCFGFLDLIETTSTVLSKEVRWLQQYSALSSLKARFNP